MRDGFVKVAVSSPELKVADCRFNKERMVEKAVQLSEQGVKLLVFPELSLTGYPCNDLFLQDTLIESASRALEDYVEEVAALDLVSFVGLPIVYKGRLYNVAAVVNGGEVLAFVPKKHIPMYAEFYEGRHFDGWDGPNEKMDSGLFRYVPIGNRFLFQEYTLGSDFSFAVEICEDLWVPNPPSGQHAVEGALIIANLSASDELTGKAVYRRELVKNQSARTLSAYLYADAGEGESTQDMVFAGHNLIAENGAVLAEAKSFADSHDLITEIDLKKLKSERRRMTTFTGRQSNAVSGSGLSEKGCGYETIVFEVDSETATTLTRRYSRTPFVPETKTHREERCDEILSIQANGLAKRLKHTGCRSAVIGLSGGLDSTLALLVTVRAFDLLGIDKKGIECVTMPCFGTTNRTYENAVHLAEELGTNLREINIKEAVTVHFRDLGHNESVHDITYENSQARERTQLLMDIANQTGGMVIGTGDMSELALGWATYNGDHMSMYGVNCSVPKTLVRYLVQYFADTSENDTLKRVLYDILDTPVSPELLPPKEGEISQKTEDLVGPYELHDFFLYYVLRFGFTPMKIFRLASYVFDGIYEKDVIFKWLSTFYHRFFRQQFKRSCLPDGPKVGTVAVSPRGDLRMPSDASDALWKEELEWIRESLV